MIDCKRAQDSMSDYVEGLLEKENAKIVESHLQECPTCSLVCERMQQTMDLLGNLQEFVPSAAFEQNLWAKVRSERKRPHSSVLSRFPSFVPLRPWPVYAISLIVVAIGVGFLLSRGALFQSSAPVILSEGPSTRIERTTDSTDIQPPVGLAHTGEETPNYVLTGVSPESLELLRGYVSSSSESPLRREYILGHTHIRGPSDGEYAVEYVLPTTTPYRTVKVTTFSP